MIDPARISKEVFKAIKSHNWQVKLYDESGMSTVDPAMAVRFYVEEPNFLIYVDGEDESIEINRNGNEKLEIYLPVINSIKRVAKEYIYRCDIRDYGKKITPKDFSYRVKQVQESNEMSNSYDCTAIFPAKDKTPYYTVEGIVANSPAEAKVAMAKECRQERLPTPKRITVKLSAGTQPPISESTMQGSKKTSKQIIENVKLIIKHRSEVDESVVGSRSRDIAAIFLEHAGERIRFPLNNLLGARAMASHINHGGHMHDAIGETIVAMTGKMIKLKEFHRYAKRNKLISENTGDVIDALLEGIDSLRSDLHSIYKKRTYETTIARLSERENIIIEGDDSVDYKDMFTVKKFDEVFEAILPMISNLVQEKNMKMKRIEESSLSPIRATKGFGTSTASGVIYETKEAQFGSKLKDMAYSIRENDELSGFLTKLGEKLISEGKLSTFEMKIVGNVISNMVFETEKQAGIDLISESVLTFSRNLGKIEKSAYSSLLNEGISDVLAGAKGKVQSMFKSEPNVEAELLDLGKRLKKIEAAIQGGAGEVEEAATGFGKEALKKPTLVMFRVAVQRFLSARKGLGLANQLKDPASRAKHKSQMMANMNLLRREVESLERSLEIEKEVDDNGKRVMPEPNKFMGGIWGKNIAKPKTPKM